MINNKLTYKTTLLVFIVSSLVCSNPAPAPRVILCSFYPMYIMTLNVADNVPGVKVVTMTKPQTGCLHDYQLTPQDLTTLSTAWVLVVNGGGMESFIDKAVKQRPQLIIVNASKGIPLIKGGGDEGDNPHVWVSLDGAMKQVKNIGDGLSAADPGSAEKYHANAQAYIAKLKTLQNKMHAELASFSGREIITFHEAFPYFAKEFGLHIAAVVEREPGSEPSAGELARTIRIIKHHAVTALFAEPQYPAKAAQTIAAETGLKVYELDPAATGPAEKGAYIRIMEANGAVLKEALQ
ncbi:MAG: metal ABC transporter substrate-binding protein [Chitinivibrionales bacterium]|nr:metal ABC transporter substrate-binding protein [Chitinivibrionales bacterium]